MQSGTYFNRQDVYDNMYDFIRDISSRKLDQHTPDQIFQEILDATTTHFQDTDKALMIPMIWSIVQRHCTGKTLQYITTAKQTWFKKQTI